MDIRRLVECRTRFIRREDAFLPKLLYKACLAHSGDCRGGAYASGSQSLGRPVGGRNLKDTLHAFQRLFRSMVLQHPVEVSMREVQVGMAFQHGEHRITVLSEAGLIPLQVS